MVKRREKSRQSPNKSWKILSDKFIPDKVPYYKSAPFLKPLKLQAFLKNFAKILEELIHLADFMQHIFKGLN